MESTKLIVDLKNIKYNIEQIKNYVGKDVTIMLIVKANGYGTYLNHNIEILDEFGILGVGFIKDALELRSLGYKKDIFILSPLLEEEINVAIKNDFIINSSNILELDMKKIIKGKIRTHLEIETGMKRSGLFKSDVNRYIKMLKENKSICLEGLFTHLSSPSTDREYTLNQLKEFESVIEIFKENKVDYKYTHAVCSEALYGYKDYFYNMVRIGSVIYGYYPDDSSKKAVKIKPTLTLKTKVIFLETIKKGEYIGYNKKNKTEKDIKTATVPFGYTIGLFGLDKKGGYVVINGKKAKVLSMCMETTIIDVSDIKDVKIGDDVYFWDNEKLTLESVASTLGIHNYQIMTTLSTKIEKDFVK